jgi:hypothetical protein
MSGCAPQLSGVAADDRRADCDRRPTAAGLVLVLLDPFAKRPSQAMIGLDAVLAGARPDCATTGRLLNDWTRRDEPDGVAVVRCAESICARPVASAGRPVVPGGRAPRRLLSLGASLGARPALAYEAARW